MPSQVKLLTVIEYFRDSRPWKAHHSMCPSWEEVEVAIRRMENYCFPIVQLNLTEFDDDENIFNVIGGVGRYALFRMTGDWQYEDPNGTDDPVHLWDSDQGYECLQSNVLIDVERVLGLAKVFYETGSYEAIEIAARAG
jgi:hypothetical protein